MTEPFSAALLRALVRAGDFAFMVKPSVILAEVERTAKARDDALEEAALKVEKLQRYIYDDADRHFDEAYRNAANEIRALKGKP